jgi:uncharacterized integral membrane protein
MRVLRFLILAPLAALILIFAYANRAWVTINFDPFGGSGLAPVAAPQYVILLLAMAFGVVIGGVSTWLGQAKYRRAAREARAEAARLRGELQTQRIPAPSLARPA